MSGFSTRFDDALRYAADVHRLQLRKVTKSLDASDDVKGIPYIGHLLGVASIVIDAGGNEDEAIAALLHDAAEDQGGKARLADIAERFGARVAAIVEGCSDSLTADPEKKSAWRPRKEQYIAHLIASNDTSVYLVSAADKCHNARATARDLAFAPDPDLVWSKFNPDAGPTGTVWYYSSLKDAYAKGPIDPRRDLIVSELSIALNEIRFYAEPQIVETSDEDVF